MSDLPDEHRRRPARRQRYSGSHPRKFEERYKELDPQRHPDMHAHIRAQGRTPAGTHVPVMLDAVIHRLRPQPGQTFVDCTLGYGGHADALAARLAPGGRLITLDVDHRTAPASAERLRAGHPDVSISLHLSSFAGLERVLAEENCPVVDGILADLGVSSMQLDDPARGFSYKHDGPLDMRMGPRARQTAADWLARLDEHALAAALRDLADEPDAESIANEIVRTREARPIRTTHELAECVRGAKGLSGRPRRRTSEPAGPHPAARTFQALRILVNDELGALRELLRIAPHALAPEATLVILSFHSGEDRLVKHAFENGRHTGFYRQISDEPERPTPLETHDNPRAAPARLRWAVRAAFPQA